jgi:hypothetical protein
MPSASNCDGLCKALKPSPSPCCSLACLCTPCCDPPLDLVSSWPLCLHWQQTRVDDSAMHVPVRVLEALFNMKWAYYFAVYRKSVYVAHHLHVTCWCINDNIRYNLASSLLLQIERLGLDSFQREICSFLCTYQMHITNSGPQPPFASAGHLACRFVPCTQSIEHYLHGSSCRHSCPLPLSVFVFAQSPHKVALGLRRVSH